MTFIEKPRPMEPKTPSTPKPVATPQILLINPPVRTSTEPQCHPLNLIYLAAYLRQRGLGVQILDINLNRWPVSEVLDRMDRTPFDFIGIGGIVTTYRYIKGLTRAIRRRFPKTPLILGGQVASPIAHVVFKQMPVDYVVHGYGEITLADLMEALATGRDPSGVPGLTFCRDGQLVNTGPPRFVENIDDLPLPAYDMVDMQAYLSNDSYGGAALEDYLRKRGLTLTNRRGVMLCVTRGCPNRCTFCVHEKEFPGFRVHSVEYAVRHVRHLYDNYGVRVFKLGEEFVLTRKGVWMKRFLTRIREEGLTDCYFAPSARADSITAESLAHCWEHNVYRVGFGFESGDQSVLDNMMKGVTVDHNRAAMQAMIAQGYCSTCSIMVGTPGESRQSIRNTCRMIRELKIGQAGIFYCTPYPGAVLYDWALGKGLIADEDAYLEHVSDKDASDPLLNLTPYPEFVLINFQKRLVWEVMRNLRRGDLSWELLIKKWVLAMVLPFFNLLTDAYLMIRSWQKQDPAQWGESVLDYSPSGDAFRRYLVRRTLGRPDRPVRK